MAWQASCLYALLVMFHARTPTALHAYGHAYSRPNDFSPSQYAAVAADFSIFTVEKAHAAAVYGNKSAPPPFATNSYAATVGTARKIKALNATVRVLMYWNSAIHFNFYECEAAVQPDWLLPKHPDKPIEYNYTVKAFRDWWVHCAVESVQNSSGALDGLFFDATPKIAVQSALDLELWGEMVDQVREALGDAAVLIDNGFYLPRLIAGEDVWAHTHFSYVESLAKLTGSQGEDAGDSNSDNPDVTDPEDAIQGLVWLSNASLAHPNWTLCGHGPMTSNTAFVYGLVKYMLITSSVERGWFLANNGYSIDGGLLEQPDMDLYYAGGAGCGEPLSPYFFRVGGEKSTTLRREFKTGSVTLDLENDTASIDCPALQSI